MLLENSFELCDKYLSKCSWGLKVYIYKMFISSVDPCMLI